MDKAIRSKRKKKFGANKKTVSFTKRFCNNSSYFTVNFSKEW